MFLFKLRFSLLFSFTIFVSLVFHALLPSWHSAWFCFLFCPLVALFLIGWFHFWFILFIRLFFCNFFFFQSVLVSPGCVCVPFCLFVCFHLSDIYFIICLGLIFLLLFWEGISVMAIKSKVNS